MMNRWKIGAGYFMQPAVQRGVCGGKFLDNSIQEENHLCLALALASLIPFPSLKQNLKNRKGMISFPNLVFVVTTCPHRCRRDGHHGKLNVIGSLLGQKPP